MKSSVAILILSGSFLFAQQGNQQNKQPSNQRDSSSPPKTEGETSASARSTNRGTLSNADRRFVEQAMQGGRMEVELGRLAQEKASDPGVKAFGQRMVTDHSKANSELEQLAQRKGLTTAEDTKGKGKDQGKQAELANLSGEQFDRAYVRMMVADHQKDVSEFDRAARNSQDPEVKSFASKTLPTLREHLNQIQMLQQQLGKSQDRKASK